MCCLKTIRISMFKFWHNTDGRDKALQLFIVYYQVFLLELMVDRNWYRRPELGHLSVVHVLYVASLKWTRPALPWPLLNLYKHEQLLEFWVVICLNTTVHGCFTFSCCFILNTLHLSTVPNYLPIENASAWSRQAGILRPYMFPKGLAFFSRSGSQRDSLKYLTFPVTIALDVTTNWHMSVVFLYTAWCILFKQQKTN